MIGAHNGPFRKNRGIAQAGLDFDFRANLYQQIDTDGTDMARTSTFTDLVTVSRTSKKTNAGGWDFTSGSTVGAITEVNNNEPALDGTKGILIEETSTNEIRNPRCEGAVAGTPGTAPTNWLISSGGMTTEVVGSGVENGWPYADLRWYGTPTSSPYVWLEAANVITAADGQTWTGSAGARVVAGSAANISGMSTHLVEYAGTSIVKGNAVDIEALDARHRRVAITTTLNGGGTVDNVRPRLDFYWDGSGDVDMTVRIYAPQCEEKEFPTSPILPPVGTPGASTRDNDLITLATSAWTSSGDYSLYASGALNVKPTGTAVIAGLGDTFNDTTYVSHGASSITASIVSGGVSVASLTPGGQSAPVAGDTFKIAVGVQANSFAFSLGGATQATGTSGALPGAPVRLKFGSSAWSASYGNGYNGYFSDFRYFPERLTNAQLEALVGN